MHFNDTMTSAFKGVTANVTRSMLTMLGIIIGVGSVVLMTSIGASVQGSILSQVSTLGAQSMILVPGKDPQGPGMPVGAESVTLDDVETLGRLGTVKTVAPVILVDGIAVAGREQVQHQILGTTEHFFRNQSITVERGRLLDPADEKGSFVAVLGPDTATSLFGDRDPLGQRIKILDRSFTVVGVLHPVGSQFFQSIDERIYIPLTAAKILTGNNHVSFVTMQAATNIDLAIADAEALIRQRHRIRNPEGDPANDDFHIHSAEQATQTLGAVSLALTALLSAIAGISLVVGGIGIMNIMLVAVTERTREIGLRKAVGARRRDILLQFLTEAVMLTGIGGLIGLGAGLGLGFVASLLVKNVLSSYAFSVSIPSILLSIVVSAATGLIFGLYPARRAAMLSPMEALRYE